MKKVFILILLVIFASACPPDKKQASNSNTQPNNLDKLNLNYNLVVLLDLSERLQNPRQPERDKKIIGILLDRFEQRQRNKYYKSEDTFGISIVQQANSTLDLGEIGKHLQIDMKGIKRDEFDVKKKTLLSSIDTLYKQASNNLQKDGDIYRYFQYNLATHLRPSKNYYNKLIILTDGYISFKPGRQKGTYMADEDLKILRDSGPDWENTFDQKNMGLDATPIITNNRNLQVMLAEITPKDTNINEMGILKKYWKTWFEGIGVYDPYFLEKIEPIESGEKTIIDFLEKKTLQDKMKEPIELRGENYQSHLLENREIVSNLKGKYFIIDLTNNSKNTLEKKPLFFSVGEYTIANFDDYGPAIKEFDRSVRMWLEKSEVKNDYEIFVKGSADQGHENYKRNFTKGFEFREICRLPKLDNAVNLFKGTEDCYNIQEPLKNSDLPNLRAKFLKEKFDSYYSADYKRTKILEGAVVLRISELERNGTFILYLPDKFFTE